MSKVINTFDIDGVIFMGKGIGGVYPGPDDFIITGRSVEESKYTWEMMEEKGITNYIFFNPLPYDQKTRESSGSHKAKTINNLRRGGYIVNIHFEDDPIQADVIRRECPEVNVVLLVHDLVEKENIKHEEW